MIIKVFNLPNKEPDDPIRRFIVSADATMHAHEIVADKQLPRLNDPMEPPYDDYVCHRIEARRLFPASFLERVLRPMYPLVKPPQVAWEVDCHFVTRERLAEMKREADEREFIASGGVA